MLGAGIRLYSMTLSIANEVVSGKENVIYDLGTPVHVLNYSYAYLKHVLLLQPTLLN